MAYTNAPSIILLNPSWPQTSTADGYAAISSLVGLHLARAEGIINSYITDRYDVTSLYTVTGGPVILKMIAEDITTYFTIRSSYNGDNQSYNEWVDKYNLAIEQLELIKDGDIALTDSNGTPFSERTTERINLVESTTEDYAPFFEEDDPLDWVVDSDKLDSINDDRG